VRRAQAALVAALSVTLIAALYLLRDRAGDAAGTTPGASAPVRHVLLITIDTLRADRLGSYGYAAARTPRLDALAARGARFTHAYANAPITLTSHASLMTGRYPPGHGARHNGMAMPAGAPTLAEAFKRAGFETGAFVSAFPLDRRFGLARGFDTYDDEMPRAADGRRANERAGAVTIDRALTWIRARPQSSRVFAWMHLFEPHAPYGSPADGRSAAARYDDEIAAVDREIGRLLDAWRDLPSTLVVATADHGEAFGEHKEIGHSIFVYDTTLQVPLAIAGPGVASATVDQPVALTDLAPTIAALAQVEAFDSDGVDLRLAMRGESLGSRALYAESFAPLLDFGWASLRSLRRDGLKLIAAPRPELYDVAADRGETRSLAGERSDAARELTTRVDRISAAELTARPQGTDPEVLSRLRALGYASGSGSSAAGARPDPKDRVEIASQMASVIAGEAQGPAAERALRAVVAADARNAQAHQRLGFILAESSRCAEAVRHFAAAIESGLPSADPYLGLAMCQASAGQTGPAMKTLEAARRVEPGNPIVEANIGLMALQLDRTADAVAALRQALTIDPDLHQARFALARALGRAGQRDAALRETGELLRRLPAAAPQRAEVERLAAALR
jgi:choline-sulfatase